MGVKWVKIDFKFKDTTNIDKKVKKMKKGLIFIGKLGKFGKEKAYLDWFQLCPLGTFINQVTGKPQTVSAKEIEQIAANFQNEPSGRVVFDYEHQTIKGIEAPASGWIIELEDRGADGLWCKVEWTKRALKYLEEKEYEFRSPVIIFNFTDERGKFLGAYLHSAALTNKPWIREMDALAANLNLDNFCEGGFGMLEELKKLLGLKQEATEAEVMAAALELKKSKDSMLVAKSEIMAKLGAKDEAGIMPALDSAVKHEGFVAKSMYDAAVSERDVLKAQIAQSASREVEAIVAKALEGGKITPAQKAWANDYAQKDRPGFEAFIASAAVVIPAGRQDTGVLPVGGKQEMNAEEMMVCKQLGMSAEDYLKFSKSEN